MNRLLITILFSFIIAAAANAQKKENSSKQPEATVYYEVVLEDFENTTYDNSNISYRVVKKNQEGHLSIRDQFPAPVSKSKKYLGVKIFGRQGDYFTITFPKKLIIENNCSSISIWIYGKGFTGELSAFIEDANGDAHRIHFGKLNFLGWRKLSVKLPKSIVQEDEYLNQKRTIKLTKLIYQPGNTKRLRPKWQYFYIDDISARVRKKYSDRQSDDW